MVPAPHREGKQEQRHPARRTSAFPEKARTEKARRETGNYPMPDRGHTISALRLSELEYERGTLTKDQYDRIQRKARKKLRKKKRNKKDAAKRA